MKYRKHLAFARVLQLLHFTFIILHLFKYLGFLTIFAKKTHPSFNVILTHCCSVTYCNGLKPIGGNAKIVKESKFLTN